MTEQEQIDEMGKVMPEKIKDPLDNSRYIIFGKSLRREIARIYYNAGYRKLPEDSVVLSREEYEKGIIERESMRNQITELFNDREQACKETAEKILLLRGYITKQFHKYHDVRDNAEYEYKKCKEEIGKEILNNTWHRADAIMFILEDIATEFDKLIKSYGVEIKE